MQKTNPAYILLSYASLFCYGLMDNSRGPAYPHILERFGLSMSFGSLLFAVATIAGLPVIMMGRRWLKFFGEVKAHLVLLLLAAAGCFGMGFSGFFRGGYSVMLLFAAVYGAGLGGMTISANILVTRGSSPHAMRRLFSGLHTLYGLASVLAPVIFGLAAGGGLDWRFLFMGLSLPPVVVMVSSLKVRQMPLGESNFEKPAGVSFGARIAVGLAISFYAASEIAISSRLVLFAHKTMGVTAVDAAPYLSAFFLLLLLGRFVFSVFRFPWSSLNLMAASAAVSLALFLPGIFIHPAFLSACGLSMSFYFPCGMDYISRRFGDNAGYMMTSVMTSVAVAIALMHVLIGAAADGYGIKISMLMGPALLAVALVMLVIIPKKLAQISDVPHS